jgi:Mce-associated membrane protein
MTTANGHRTITRLEFTVPVDTPSITEGSPPALEERSASADLTADNDERTEVRDEAEAAGDPEGVEAAEAPTKWIRRVSWSRILAYGVLPGLVLLLALGAGYLKWQDGSARQSQAAAAKTVQVATESTIAMLSYRPDTAERALPAAANRLTGPFRGDYMKLVTNLVIPAAKQKQISAVATVPAAASVSATQNHAVVLVFIDQTTLVGTEPPTTSASSVRVTLDKVGDQWLVSQFEPI